MALTFTFSNEPFVFDDPETANIEIRLPLGPNTTEYIDYHIHTTVICPQSTYFANMLKWPCLEETTRVVHLPFADYDEELVRALLMSMYSHEYEVPAWRHNEAHPGTEDYDFHIRLHALADVWGVPTLVKATAKRLHDSFWRHGDDPFWASNLTAALVLLDELIFPSNREARDAFIQLARRVILVSGENQLEDFQLPAVMEARPDFAASVALSLADRPPMFVEFKSYCCQGDGCFAPDAFFRREEVKDVSFHQLCDHCHERFFPWWKEKEQTETTRVGASIQGEA